MPVRPLHRISAALPLAVMYVACAVCWFAEDNDFISIIRLFLCAVLAASLVSTGAACRPCFLPLDPPTCHAPFLAAAWSVFAATVDIVASAGKEMYDTDSGATTGVRASELRRSRRRADSVVFAAAIRRGG